MKQGEVQSDPEFMNDLSSDSENVISPAVDACATHFIGLHGACATIIENTLQFDTSKKHARAYSFAPDFELWLSTIGPRREQELYQSAVREYQYSLLAVLQGQYRQAFAALRLFLELTVAGLYLSANEISLRQWLRGEKYTNWEEMTKSERGVFSDVFVKVFNEALLAEARVYSGLARTLYTECSEIAHGNCQAPVTLPTGLQFDSAVFDFWHEKAKTARVVTSFGLCVRYFVDLTDTQKRVLEATVMDQLGHLKQIREFYGATR